MFVGFFDEGNMALVEVPHGGYQAYGLSLGSHPPRPSPHLILAADYLCFSNCHFFTRFLFFGGLVVDSECEVGLSAVL